MIQIVIAKGRIFNESRPNLLQLGFRSEDLILGNSNLVIDHPSKPLKLIVVRSMDVATLVQIGLADLGIVGKDILMENKYGGIYELDNLKYSTCHMVLAAPKNYKYDTKKSRILKVASKYVNYTQRYFSELSQQVEVIKLHGAVETAPQIGLSDMIIDLSDTGRSLEKNSLVIVKHLFNVSARLIANKAATKTKAVEISRLRYNLTL